MRRYFSIAAVLLVGGGFILLQHVKDAMIMGNIDSDIMQILFWEIVIATSVSFLLGGLLMYLCFRPFINFAEWCKREMRQCEHASCGIRCTKPDARAKW